MTLPTIVGYHQKGIGDIWNFGRPINVLLADSCHAGEEYGGGEAHHEGDKDHEDDH